MQKVDLSTVEIVDLTPKQCCVCFEDKCFVMHCDTCIGDGKHVCNACIVNMLTLDEHSMPVYECPTCRTSLKQEWFLTDVSALQKTIQLLRQRPAGGDDEEEVQHTIFQAIDADNLPRVQQLIEQDPSLVHYRDGDGDTPLRRAARGGYIHIGETPLMRAARNRRREIIHYLVEHGADVNTTNNNGYTPLMWVASVGHIDIVQCLVEHGANVNAANNGDTALMWAASFGNLDIIQYLVERGANVNAADSNGETALSRAVRHGRTNVADYIRSVNK